MNDSLSQLDEALLRLRRFAQAPAGHRTPGPHESIEMSTVLVVDAVQQLAESGEVASVKGVADRLSVSPSTASRLIDRASTAGMVARRRSLDDSRQAIITLTDAGRDLALRARDYRHARLADMLAPWPAARIERFAHDLRDFAQATFTQREGDAT